MKAIGQDEYNDFNTFRELVDKELKKTKQKLSASEKNAILSAVIWYDTDAEKVIKSVTKLSAEKLDDLLNHLNCKENQLQDFGYYPSGKKGEWIEYETEGDLRDMENVPLKESIHDYFLKEVTPHEEHKNYSDLC